MGEKSRYSNRVDIRRKQSFSRPRMLPFEYRHVSDLPGYQPTHSRITFNILVDADVPPFVTEGLGQQFDVKYCYPYECGISDSDDRKIAEVAKQRKLIVLTRNYTDFFNGNLIPIHKFFGIFAIDARGSESRLFRVIANMGAVMREIGPHFSWTWWNKTKIKFGAEKCSLIRLERSSIVRRSIVIRGPNDKAWFKIEN